MYPWKGPLIPNAAEAVEEAEVTKDEIDAILDDLRGALRRLRNAVDNYPRLAAIGESHDELRQAIEEYRTAHKNYEDAVSRLLSYEEQEGS